MKKIIYFLFFIVACGGLLTRCTGHSPNKGIGGNSDSHFVNTKHLDHLYTLITFPNGVKAAGIYIYAEAPDYRLVGDSDEGFTCVDDVSRAALVYLRNKNFSIDTSIQSKAINLIRFILQMQSVNGYFYNFLFPDSINTVGKTSVSEPNWWSWRALQTLTEGEPMVKSVDVQLAREMNAAVKNLVEKIKAELVNIPLTTKVVNGISVPQWLPAGSATDQAAILILGLIPWCETTGDRALTAYVKKLADAIVMMQKGDATHFPYSCFLSWENVWHAYGNDQANALFKAGRFLKDSMYSYKALNEVNNFYSKLLKNGYKSSFAMSVKKNGFEMEDEKRYAQIAYGIRPMIFAAAEAYRFTGDVKYADMAGQVAAWFSGANETGIDMYDSASGRCYDGIIGRDSINYNSGAESTIEALLSLQMIEADPVLKTAYNKYK